MTTSSRTRKLGRRLTAALLGAGLALAAVHYDIEQGQKGPQAASAARSADPNNPGVQPRPAPGIQ
jgi:hypothetical protein